MSARLAETIQQLARDLVREVIKSVRGTSLGEAADWLDAAPRGSAKRSPLPAPVHGPGPPPTALREPLEDLVAKTRALMPELMEAGELGLEAAARRLGINARTMQRRLVDQGVSYASLLDAARRDRAEREVGGGDKSLGEIARLLGFTQASAFSRAFRRWTGATPRAYRLARREREPTAEETRSPAHPAPAKTRRRVRRDTSPPDPEQVLDRLVDLLREKPTGIRAEELRAQLSQATRPAAQRAEEPPEGEA